MLSRQLSKACSMRDIMTTIASKGTMQAAANEERSGFYSVAGSRFQARTLSTNAEARGCSAHFGRVQTEGKCRPALHLYEIEAFGDGTNVAQH